MAAHNWYTKDRANSARRTYEIPFKIVTSTGGLITTPTNSKKEGIASITRSAAGRYVFVLDAKYTDVIDVRATVKIAGTAAYTTLKATRFILRDSLTTNNTLTIQFIDMAVNTDQDVADGATIIGTIVLRDSTP